MTIEETAIDAANLTAASPSGHDIGGQGMMYCRLIPGRSQRTGQARGELQVLFDERRGGQRDAQ
jgi:hypothetical protein